MANPLTLIVGAGPGLSSALARAFADRGDSIALAARDTDKLKGIATETSAACFTCDASDSDHVSALFAALPQTPRVVIYNPSARVRGPIAEVDPEEVRRALEITAFGAFLVGQQAARAMLADPAPGGQHGTILFTGASAGVKGYPQSASFAMGKFAQRGLAQSMARELHPRGIHVAWINIDGMIRNPGRVEAPDAPDSMLDPAAIAQSYVALAEQQRSAWSEELSLRPWVEKF